MLAKIGVDTAENELLSFIQYFSILFIRVLRLSARAAGMEPLAGAVSCGLGPGGVPRAGTLDAPAGSTANLPKFAKF